MRLCRLLLICGLGLVGPLATSAQAGDELLEVSTGQATVQGRVLAHNRQTCWILGRDGRLHDVNPGEVTAFRPLGQRFRGYTGAEMRGDLQRELGPKFEVAATQHYIVAAGRGRAQAYATLLEAQYRSFVSYFSARGFRLESPSFALVAIVFPDQAQFAQYAQQDGVTAGRGLMGYYLPATNRIALFDPAGAVVSSHETSPAGWMPGATSHRDSNPFALPADSPWLGSIDGDLADTLIHEATHQLAFNTGLHARPGVNPRWVVEGLATVYEAPGVREGGPGVPVRARLNQERFVWFGSYASSRRKRGSLEAFLSDDQAYGASTLDAYSEGWALTFYLIETQSSRYAAYLKRIQARDPLADYPASERLADFKAHFGSNLAQFEADYLRYIERLNH